MAFSRYLYFSEDLRLGEMRCPAVDDLWVLECCEDTPLVALPETSAWIVKDGLDPIVANPNQVIFHNVHRPYRRLPLNPKGYDVSFIAIEPPLLREIAAEVDPPSEAGPHVFGQEVAPLDRGSFTLKHELLEHLRSEQPADQLFVRETLFRILARLMVGVRTEEPDGARAVRPRTNRERRRVVEEAKALLTERFKEGLSLQEIARGIHVSPFHLARVFRQETGHTLHEYRTELRMRTSFGLMSDPATDLTSVALEMGFSSHSHFSTAFRRRFGMPPSVFRKLAYGSSL
jgi:AraC-like DNA-binding protein